MRRSFLIFVSGFIPYYLQDSPPFKTLHSRIQEEIELQTYLNHLIDEDLNKKIGQLKAKKKGTAEFEVISDDAEVEVITEERDLEDQEQTLRKEADLNRDKLNNLFAKVIICHNI